MKTKILGLLAIAMVAGAFPANAATVWQLDVTSTNPFYSDFSIRFEDGSGDNLLQFSEVIFFSGVNRRINSSSPWELFDLLINVPNIAGIASCSNPGAFPCNAMDWGFRSTATQTSAFPPASIGWTYGLSRVPVPEPGTLALLGLGLAGLGLSRRRKAA